MTVISNFNLRWAGADFFHCWSLITFNRLFLDRNDRANKFKTGSYVTRFSASNKYVFHHRIWCEWEKYPGIRACIVLACHNKFLPTISWSYNPAAARNNEMDGTDLFNENKWELILSLFRSHATAIIKLAKNHEMDRWTSGQINYILCVF